MNIERIDLPSGEWVEMRDGKTVTESGRRNFKFCGARAKDPVSTPEQRAEAMIEADYYMMAMFVTAWSFGGPIPQADMPHFMGLQLLDVDDFEALLYHSMVRAREAFPDFKPTEDRGAPFLAAGAAEVGDRGREDRREAPAAGAVAPVPPDQTDRLVEVGD